MDPFSLAVGISGLTALVAKTIKLAANYTRGVRHAHEAAQSLTSELEILQSNLLRLETLLRSKSAKGHSFGDNSVLVTSTKACHVKLDVLCARIGGGPQSRISQVLWPLNEKEHQEFLRDIRACAQWIQFALAVDGCSLLSKTSDDVIDVLKSQLQSFQFTQSIDQRTLDIEISLKAQEQRDEDLAVSQEIKEMLLSLSSVEPNKRHHHVQTSGMDGTGQWLLESQKFQSWLTQGENTLWCHGIQGSGKTVLTSIVIDYLRGVYYDRSVALAFTYFDYRDQESQSAENVLASILKQVVLSNPAIERTLLSFYKRLREARQKPQLQDLVAWMLFICKQCKSVFVVIDALDECDESKYRRDFLRVISHLRRIPNLRLFTTSRSYPEDIRQAFETAIHMTVEAAQRDLERYLWHKIDNCGNADLIDEDLKVEIVTKLSHGAQKMFLLPALQIQSILEEPTPGEMEDALSSVPQSLHGIFKETLDRIQNQPESRSRLGMKALSWVFHAVRPLTLDELLDALAIRPKQTCLNRKYRPSRKLLLSCCLGLITIDEQSSSVRLVHYTVQEYFESAASMKFPSGQEESAMACLFYLMADNFSDGPYATERDIVRCLEAYPFLSYAATFWGFHPRHTASEKFEDLALTFLSNQRRVAFVSQITHYARGYRSSYWELDEVNSVTSLHAACQQQSEGLVRKLLAANIVDIDAPTAVVGTTALMRAACVSNIAAVELLLSKGADPELTNWYGTTLHCAAEAGACKSISLLLRKGIDPDIRDRHGRTALHCDVDMDLLDVVSLLVDRGADTNAKDQNGQCPLHMAAGYGSQQIIEFLLERSADINAITHPGKTALHYAAISNRPEVIQLLARKGIYLDHGDPCGSGRTPLGLAFEIEKTGTTQAILSKVTEKVDLDPGGASDRRLDWTMAEYESLLKQKLHQVAEIKKQMDTHELDQQQVASCSAMIEDITKDLAVMQEVSELRVIQRYCETGAEDGEDVSLSASEDEDDLDDIYLK